MRILIVEDDALNSRVLAHLLAEHGRVQAVASGLEARDLFVEGLERGEPFDLVCLDVMLPDMDGQEVLEHMRRAEKRHEAQPETPVVIISAVDNPEVIKNTFIHNRALAYLVKPARRETLLSILRDFGLVGQ